MTLVGFAIDGGARAVEMLPGATCQPGFAYGGTLIMEDLLVFDQHGREVSRTDRHAHCVQEVQNLWLTHPTCIVQRQDPGFDSGSKLSAVARGKGRQIRLLVGR